MDKGQYLYNYTDNKLILKLTGPLTYLHSVPFDAFITRLFEKERPEAVLIDMTETSGIDSTNLGLLARIGDICSSDLHFQADILSTSPDINRTLESMGFDTVFQINHLKGEHNGKMKSIPTSRKNDGEEGMARTILDAHKQLMAMNKENENTFRSVVEFMQKDVDKRK